MKTKIITFALLLLLIINFTFAQSETPDPTMWMADDDVFAIAIDGDYTYIGGAFKNIGPRTGYGAKITSTSDLRSTSFPEVNGTIYAVATDESGGWYIGGSFTQVGGVARNRLAQITSSGTVTSWDPNVSNGEVRSIVLYEGGVYIAGTFTSINGVTRQRIAKLNIDDGSVNTDWVANATRTVYTIAPLNGYLYVGGSFATIKDSSRNCLAKLDTLAGDVDGTWRPQMLSGNSIMSIVTDGISIFVGGLFGPTTIGGKTRQNLAKLNSTNGDADDNWNPNPDRQIFTMTVSGSNLYVGGYFTTIGGQSRNRIAKLQSDGTALSWNPSVGNVGVGVRTIVKYKSDIFFAGDFNSVGGQVRNYIAKVDSTNGNLNTTWDPNANSQIWGIVFSKTSPTTLTPNLYVGGSFTSISRKTQWYLAKINNLNGSLDEAWRPQSLDNWVYSIAVDENSVYAGGLFQNAGGVTNANRLAKFNKTDGTVDAAFLPNPTAKVKTIVINSNDLYVGGEFTTICGIARRRIAKLDKTTYSLDGWDPNMTGTVNSIVISGEDVFIGGVFSAAGNGTYPRNNLAKFTKTNDIPNPSWIPETNGQVYSLSLSGSNLYAAGAFTTIGGLTRNYIAKLDTANGNAISNFNANCNSTVFSVVANGNIVFAGGQYTSIGGQSLNRLAKLNGITGAALDWNPNLVANVRTMAIDGDNLYVGAEVLSGWNIDYHTFFARYNDVAIPMPQLNLKVFLQGAYR
ncbi:MAG: delta-60 repeat domain-containing protein [Ignavibacteriales bacterium]|nr:delta-60 repeat domain-containing protein [Ignavibacteriales bacterium]